MSQILGNATTQVKDSMMSVPAGDCDWQKRCQELTAECDSLRKELAEAKVDRDAYLKAVKALLPVPEYNFTKEELFAQIGREPSFAELISELERDLEK
jgi:hypothetical protein